MRGWIGDKDGYLGRRGTKRGRRSTGNQARVGGGGGGGGFTGAREKKTGGVFGFQSARSIFERTGLQCMYAYGRSDGEGGGATGRERVGVEVGRKEEPARKKQGCRLQAPRLSQPRGWQRGNGGVRRSHRRGRRRDGMHGAKRVGGGRSCGTGTRIGAAASRTYNGGG